MGVAEDLADALALDMIKYIDASGDEDAIAEIIAVLGASSQTAEEAFTTALRVRRANIQARAVLVKKVKAFKVKHDAANKET